MNTHTAARIGAVDRWRWPPMAVAAALLGFLLPLLHRAVLRDGDTYWHLAAGQWMLDRTSVPHTDPFSSTMPGAPWVAHEWLSEVLLTLTFNAAGWGGLQLLCGLALALTLLMVAAYLERWLDQPAAWVCTVVAAAGVFPSLLARPHLLALVPLAAWCIGLLRARERQRAPSWWLLPLMTVWANLHGSFVLGLTLAGALGLEAGLAASASRAATLRRWAVFLAAATGAAALTPHGWFGLLFPLQLMRMDLVASITEWRPPDFSHIQPLTLAIMALLYTALTRPLRLPPVRVFIVLALLYMALTHSRHQMVACMVGALVLAAPLGQALGCTPVARRWPSAALRWSAAALGLALLAAGVRLTSPLVRGDDSSTPETALRRVPPALLSQPVFNSYEFGGYLIYRHVRPFIDGRADMYGSDFMRAFQAPFGSDRPAFEQLVRRYDVRWALIAADSKPMLYLLDTLPGWRRLYGDSIAIVYVRDR